MAITPLPTPPSTSDPSNFSTMADAFLAALATFVTQANALGTSLFLVLQNYISGLTLSTAGSSATFGIAAGQAANSTNAVLMALASAYTKTTSAWALGSGNGALDTGAIATSTWYHVYLIQRSDTGVTDILISTSASAPTMPTSYDYKRRIGAMKTNGSSQWTSFVQLGDRFLWAVNVVDAAAGSTLADSNAHLVTLSVPTGVQIDAEFIINPGYSSTVDLWLITSPDQTDSTPTTSLNDVKFSASFIGAYLPLSRRTNTSGQIRVRAIVSGGGTPSGAYGILTQGWRDDRGRNG